MIGIRAMGQWIFWLLGVRPVRSVKLTNESREYIQTYTDIYTQALQV